MNADYSVRLARLFAQQAYGLWLIRYQGDVCEVAKPAEIIWERVNVGERTSDVPTLALDVGAIKAIALELTDRGQLPKGALTNDAELTAVKQHLADLRLIAFNELGVRS